MSLCIHLRWAYCQVLVYTNGRKKNKKKKEESKELSFYIDGLGVRQMAGMAWSKPDPEAACNPSCEPLTEHQLDRVASFGSGDRARDWRRKWALGDSSNESKHFSASIKIRITRASYAIRSVGGFRPGQMLIRVLSKPGGFAIRVNEELEAAKKLDESILYRGKKYGAKKEEEIEFLRYLFIPLYVSLFCARFFCFITEKAPLTSQCACFCRFRHPNCCSPKETISTAPATITPFNVLLTLWLRWNRASSFWTYCLSWPEVFHCSGW